VTPVAVETSPSILNKVTPRRYPELAAILLLVAAGCISVVRALTQRWLPASDEALIELLVRRVPQDMPLVGVYSRLGFSHPGPAEFVALAIPYRLFGSSSAALCAGIILLHIGAITLAWWTTERLDRITAMIVLVFLGLTALSVFPTEFRSPWNPFIALIFAGTLLLCSWSAAERDPVGSVLLFPMGSLLVQTHGAALPLVTTVSVCAVVAAALAHRSQPSQSGIAGPVLPIRAWLLGSTIAVLMWIPPFG